MPPTDEPAGAVHNRPDSVRCVLRASMILSLVVLLTGVACNLNREEVDFTFDNRTDALLCFERSEKDAASGGCPQEIKPRAKTSWLPGCGYGGEAEKLPLTVIVIVEEGGHRIYDRTLECRVWQDSDRTFVIEQRGQEFVVTAPRWNSR